MSPGSDNDERSRRHTADAGDTRCRLYDTARWRRMRERQLSVEPLCRMCRDRGQVVEATVADHVIPHRGDTLKFWFGELQSLCAHDHSRSKQREEIHGYSDTVGEDGWPIDPRHPANR